jgi:hypothetical protein
MLGDRPFVVSNALTVILNGLNSQDVQRKQPDLTTLNQTAPNVSDTCACANVA